MIPIKSSAQATVIIPAHNAYQTLPETLDSLLAQTSDSWEAIIVNDGSHDETPAIAAEYAKSDARIRFVNQEQGGVSAARNAGARLARFDWLLFLDADDWLLPSYLERMMEVLESGIDVDAVFCGAARVTSDGLRVREAYGDLSGDMFNTFARQAVFPIHACIVRKSVVDCVGGFDTMLRTCEEWDLWQRVARTGAHFFSVSQDVLALYRTRPASASMDAPQMLQDGLSVITRGHSADPRVLNPEPAHEDGFARTRLASTYLGYACWCAGLLLGQEEDARYLLGMLDVERAPQLDPEVVAWSIGRAALISTGLTPDNWDGLWSRIKGKVDVFLALLETKALVPQLASHARTALEQIGGEASQAVACRLPTTRTIGIDINQPISDVSLDTSSEKLQCLVRAGEKYLGKIELPVCDGLVPRYVIVDAISAEFAWPILGLFFKRTLYSRLVCRREGTGLSLWRGDVRLTDELPVDEQSLRDQTHDLVGWTIFLQEMWGRTRWSGSDFYDSQAVDEPASSQVVDGEWVTVEVSDAVPELQIAGEEVDALFTVGGSAVGVVTLQADKKHVSAQELRVALTLASGFELCRVAVREALLEIPFDEPISLRTRLASGRSGKLARGGQKLEVVNDVLLAPKAAPAFDLASFAEERLLVMGRRSNEAIGTSASRRAMLPAAAFECVLEVARGGQESLIATHELGEQPDRVLYAPELITRSALERRKQQPLDRSAEARAEDGHHEPVYGRHYFETLFATRTDPWRYTNLYEQRKYEQTLSLVPRERIERAIELGCAEGHFTVRLAARVESLIACDISQVALDRAARRLKDYDNVRLARLDFMKENPPGRFNLIVCSEVLYFVEGREQLRAVARKLADALEPGGYLVTAHANQVVDEPDQPGFDFGGPHGAKIIGETLSATRGLHLLKELRTPLYRVHLFRRVPRRYPAFLRRKAEVLEAEHYKPLPPEIASLVQWKGDRRAARRTSQGVVTAQLPILMYHSVSKDDRSNMPRYRVMPEVFEEQLGYLRDAGFRSVSLEEWRVATEAKRPLPGRALILTFDDGYLDFLTDAWPLLTKYGFSATVFLVAEKIGRTSEWDRHKGQELPLLGWKEIRELRKEGIEFGSHCLSHRPLTDLPIEEVACEAARSKAIIEQGLGARIQALAYPYGASDGTIHHLAGACGYTFGLTCRPGPSKLQGSHLALPRIEITGHDGWREFVKKVGNVYE